MSVIRLYKIHDPYTGTYHDVTSREELKTELVKAAWKAYLVLTHGTPFGIVDINENGSQTWVSPPQEEMDEILAVEKEFLDMLIAENVLKDVPEDQNNLTEN